MSWSLVTHLQDDHSPISRTLVPVPLVRCYLCLQRLSLPMYPVRTPLRSPASLGRSPYFRPHFQSARPRFSPNSDTPLPTPVPTLSWFSLFSPNLAPAPPPVSCSSPWCHLPDPSPQWLGERGRADGTSYLGLAALLGWRGRGANSAGLRDLPCPQACHRPCPQSCPPGRAPSGAPQDAGPSKFRSLVRADQDAFFCGDLVLVHVDQSDIAGKVVVGPRGPTRGFS